MEFEQKHGRPENDKERSRKMSVQYIFIETDVHLKSISTRNDETEGTKTKQRRLTDLIGIVERSPCMEHIA